MAFISRCFRVTFQPNHPRIFAINHLLTINKSYRKHFLMAQIRSFLLSPLPTSLALSVSPRQIQCVWRDSLQFLLKPGGGNDFPELERGDIICFIHSSHVFCGGPCLHTLSEISESPTPELLWDCAVNWLAPGIPKLPT